jgi:hypothetical protein
VPSDAPEAPRGRLTHGRPHRQAQRHFGRLLSAEGSHVTKAASHTATLTATRILVGGSGDAALAVATPDNATRCVRVISAVRSTIRTPTWARPLAESSAAVAVRGW